MARIRTIKPEFWTDETVVELDFADRLLFIGLWNFADDQGFLPYRPKRIKMQIFPGDDYDVPAGLERLWESSLVSLYASPDGPLVHIRNWERHQKISNPAREKYSRSDLRKLDSWDTDVQSPLDSYPAEGKGREGKGRDLSCASADAERDSDPDQASIEDDFADWYERYPRKRGKGQALKAYRAARKKVDHQTLIDAIEQQGPRLTERGPEFVPYPATWLNGERWDDELEADEPTNVHRLPPVSPPEVYEQPPSGLTTEEWLAWDTDRRARLDARLRGQQ